MELAVLIKVVPDHEAMSFDARALHAVRQGVELFMNPFDQRALRVALDLKRPGDRVSVASMGPPSAAPVLAEAFALGADHVSLVCDPALAGSDTLVTARVLTRLLGRSPSDVVLLGARTTDGETGQVPAEIASLRNVPLASSARKVAWEGDSGRLLVTSDTEEGWASWRVPTPCVISVGEKVAKIVHPTEEEQRRATKRSVEVVTLADLGIPPGIVGAEGSPTRVVAVRPEATVRRGVVLDEGPIADRIARAVTLLSNGTLRGASGPVRWGSPKVTTQGGRRAIVLVSAPDGNLEERSLPMLSESVRALGLSTSAVWVGPPPAPGPRSQIRRAGAIELFEAIIPPGSIDGRTVELTLERILLGRPQYEAGLFLSSHFGREVAGRVAARLGLGLTGDAVAARTGADGSIVWSKPAFGGNAVADVVSRTAPSLATIRPGVFELGDWTGGPDLTVQRIEAPTEAPEARGHRSGDRTPRRVWGPGSRSHRGLRWGRSRRTRRDRAIAPTDRWDRMGALGDATCRRCRLGPAASAGRAHRPILPLRSSSSSSACGAPRITSSAGNAPVRSSRSTPIGRHRSLSAPTWGSSHPGRRRSPSSSVRSAIRPMGRGAASSDPTS